MNKPLLILYLEDDPRDMELVRDELQQTGWAFELRTVCDRATFEAELDRTGFDVILSDYSLPGYDGMAALALARQKQPGVPFILISGTLGEELAVDCVVRGATDYVLKHHLKRLVPTMLRAVAEAEDCQKRRKAEAELRESKQLLESIVENVPLMIFLKEAQDLRFVVFNKAGEDLLGYDRKDLLGRNNLDLFPPEQAAHFTAKDREAMAEGVLLDIPEEPIQTANKGTRLLHTRKVCIKGSDGVTKYLLGISEDITERKRVEGELKQEQALNSAIIESIPGTFYMLDETGRYVRWNAYQRDEIVGKPHALVGSTNALETIHPDDRLLIQSRIANVLANGVEETVEGRVLLRGGPAFRWLLMTGRQMLIDGRPFLIGTGIDITERKQAELTRAQLEAQLRMSQKMEAIGSLAGGVAHDFNNLLSVILSYTGFAMEALREGDPLKSDLLEVQKAGERAAALTRQLH